MLKPQAVYAGQRAAFSDLEAIRFKTGTAISPAPVTPIAVGTESVDNVNLATLEGTTWKGDSPGGDKHYEFEFLPNNGVRWKANPDCFGCNSVKSKGNWKQVGNT